MEFRTQGRLGCPTDYQMFVKGLLPLIARSHGATRHVGKTPARPTVGADRDRLRLRSEFRASIALEDYESAAKLRDLLRSKDAER
jgi:protein arginine kinase activator